jgi:hypothetical protein
MEVVTSRGHSNVRHMALSTLPSAAKEDIVRVLSRHRRGKLAWLDLARLRSHCECSVLSEVMSSHV